MLLIDLVCVKNASKLYFFPKIAEDACGSKLCVHLVDFDQSIEYTDKDRKSKFFEYIQTSCQSPNLPRKSSFEEFCSFLNLS